MQFKKTTVLIWTADTDYESSDEYYLSLLITILIHYLSHGVLINLSNAAISHEARMLKSAVIRTKN